MKNLNKLLLAVIMVMTTITASSLDFTEGDLTYSTTSTGTSVYVTGLSPAGKGKSSLGLVIPGKVTHSGTTYRIWGIVDNAFANATNLTSVEMRFGTRIIGEKSFNGCSNITYCRLPSSIYRIDANAFLGCSKLTTVYMAGFNFPLGTVYSSAFPSNSNMYLYISTQSKRSTSEWKAHTGFTQFKTVEKSPYAYDVYAVDGGLYSMGYTDEDGASTVRKATLVGYSTNGGETSGGTVYKTHAETLTLTNNLPFRLDTIGSDCFSGQTTLKTIDLTNATNLKYIHMIGPSDAVANVTTLVLPKSSFGFNTSTFDYMTGVAAFQLASGSSYYSIYSGCLYDKNQTTLYRVPRGKSGSMSYPSTVTLLWTDCHENCTKITDAYLPYGLKTINSYAFYGCSALNKVRIPSSVTTLSTTAVFYKINSGAYVYINMPNPPTITATDYFGMDVGNVDLAVPYGKETTYKNAGWTGFYGYNRPAVGQAYDDHISGYLSYTVTSTASYTALDGTTYAGRCKTAAHGDIMVGGTATTVNVPNYVNISGKKYAVTMIGEQSFNYKSTSTNYTVTGCANVDTIGYGAFQNQPITSYPFAHKSSRYFMAYAFDGAGLTGTVALPYGVQMLGTYSFGHGKYSRLVVPGSISNFYGSFCANTSTLTELVINMPYSWAYNYTGWDLTGLPSNCYIRVPVGVVNHYKQNSKFSSRASYITAGAYDFAYANDYSGRYFMTILSTASTTFDGTTYDGKAKYVYHPNIAASTLDSYGFCTYYEQDQTVSSDKRKYLITEIGDSCFYGAKFATGTLPKALTRIGHDAFRASSYAENNLVLPSGLTSIGHDAFYNSKITGEVKVPTSVTSLEGWALCASTLSSIYFPADMNMPTMGSTVWSSSIGTVWVPNSRANSYLTEAKKWGTSYANKLAVFIKPSRSTVTFGSVVPVDMQAIGINAYIASAYDKTDPTKQVTLTRVNKAPENTGLLLTDLTDKEYRIPRPTGSVSAPMTNYLVPVSAQTNVYTVTGGVGYYWDNATSPYHFKKPTSNWYIGGPSYERTYGSAYLKLSSAEAGSLDDVYTNMWPYTPPVGLPGDYNGDNKVDINDVNMTINMMLGKLPYKAICDMNNDNKIDITDVNLVIQKMLGK